MTACAKKRYSNILCNILANIYIVNERTILYISARRAKPSDDLNGGLFRWTWSFAMIIGWKTAVFFVIIIENAPAQREREHSTAKTLVLMPLGCPRWVGYVLCCVVVVVVFFILEQCQCDSNEFWFELCHGDAYDDDGDVGDGNGGGHKWQIYRYINKLLWIYVG